MKKLFLLIACLLPSFIYTEDFFAIREQIVKNANVHLFGLYIHPLFAMGDVGYSTNIYSYTQYAKPDWLADPGLNLNVAALIGSRFVLSGFVRPSYSYYLNDAQWRSWNYEAGGNFYTYLGPFNISAGASSSSQRNLPSTEFAIPVRTLGKRLMLGVDLGRQDSFFLSTKAFWTKTEFANEAYLFGANLPFNMNSTQQSASFSLNKVIFTQTIVSLGVDWERYRFAFAGQRDADSLRYTIGVRFPENGRIAGSFDLGFREIRPRQSGLLLWRKPVGQGRISLRLLLRLRLHGEYIVDRFYSFVDPNYYYNQNSIGAGADYYLTRWFKAGYSSNIGVYSYRTLDSDLEIRHDRIVLQTIRLAFRVHGKWSLGLSWQIFRGDSTADDFRRRYSFIGGSISNDF